MVPSVDPDTGDLTWEKNSEVPPEAVNIKGPVGPQGPMGPTGPQGPAGPGSGDMLEDTYDPSGKHQDIFAYTDDAVKNIKAEHVTFEDGETFEEKLASGELRGQEGATGPAGPAGPAGPQGADGTPGADGKDGSPGPAGADGITWRPTVSGDGEISWTQDSSGDAPEAVNIRGPQGPAGPKGSDGAAGAPGKDGAAGTPGKDGAAAGFGTPTATVDAGTGTPSVTVTAEGADTEKVFHFKFAGLKGETGKQGPAGPTGPQGPTGTAGTNGKDGAAGATGPAGPNKVGTDTATTFSGLLKGDGSKVVQAVAGTDYATPEQVNKKADKPTIQTVKLVSSGWTENAQTVTCTGIVTDETAQIVDISPAVGGFKAYMDAGIYVSAIAADKLTFTCDTAPGEDVTVYVSIQNVR